MRPAPLWDRPGPGARRGYVGAFRTLPFPGDDPDRHVVLIPSARTLRACASCRIRPDLPVPGGWLWSVEEPAGGLLQVDGSGQARYTAPLVNSRRVFHVRATSPVDPQVFGRVALEVRPHALLTFLDAGPAKASGPGVEGLALVAGTLGNPALEAWEGDPWALAGRFTRPQGLAWIPAGRPDPSRSPCPAGGRWLVSYPGNRVFCQFEEESEGGWRLSGGDPHEWGDQALLAGPAHLATNGRAGSAWLCVISEPGQNRLRTLDALGVVRPLAGAPGTHEYRDDARHQDGPAAGARFRSPEGVAVHPSGAVYVADVGNGALRRIQDGSVSTLVQAPHNPDLNQWGERKGGRPMALPAPLNGGLALDPEGGVLYLGAGHAVLAVALEGERRGRAWTVLGHPTKAGFEAWRADPPASLAGVPCLDGPRHLAWYGGRLYLSDHGNHAFREFDPASGHLRTLAGDPGQPHTRAGPLRCASPHLPPEACAALAHPMGLAFNERGECRVATRDGVVALNAADFGEATGGS
jgi:hypothetical protein